MKVWIDILTPKQANLFSVFVRRLEEHGHEPLVTSRHYREVEGLLRVRGIKAEIIGKHGGVSLSAKVIESSRRIAELTRHVVKNSPDIAVSFCSPEAARVAYGIGVPNYAICDSPHAEAVCRLSIPLLRRLFTPKAVPKGAWRQYGIRSSDIIQYNALDPVVWIRAYAPGADPRKAMGLDDEKPIAVLRTEEEYASYLLQAQTTVKSAIIRVARSLSALGAQVVVLPRYEKQVKTLARELSGFALVPRRVIDAIGLLSQTSMFIGAGGTMTAEAALMGVPTISCYPSSPTFVDRYLFMLGLAERIVSQKRIVSRARRILAHPELRNRCRKKADRVMSKMGDPLDVIMGDLGLLSRGRWSARSTSQ